mmetsp:Transcript_13864/g.47826  ORF Transcript_13864/g.47826 Transcript_13864/m.47826 type:complete len:441 (-) Transcript_13864:850-2172(-)
MPRELLEAAARSLLNSTAGGDTDGSGSDDEPLWKYLLIPIFSAVVGYVTNVIALQMTFYPIEFFPGFLKFAQIPGQPFGLLGGWQGIIPAKAAVMAAILTELMTEKLIDVKECFQRVEPPVLAEKLAPGLPDAFMQVLDKVGKAEGPDVLASLPQVVKDELVFEMNTLVQPFMVGLLQELQERLFEVLDMTSMVVRIVEGNKRIVVNMFREIGASEFVFIERSGFYFGFLFGVIQAVVFYYYDAKWMLPVAGFVVGFATNYIAIFLIFKPVQPVKLPFGFVLHGVFLKRQVEVSKQFAVLSNEHFVNSVNMWEEMLHGGRRENFAAMFKEYTFRFFDNEMDAVKPLLALALGADKIQRIKEVAAEGLLEQFEPLLPLGHDYCDEALKVEETISESMAVLPPDEFEGVLHPVFEQDEIKLIIVGGVLGLLVGVFQVLVLYR